MFQSRWCLESLSPIFFRPSGDIPRVISRNNPWKFHSTDQRPLQSVSLHLQGLAGRAHRFSCCQSRIVWLPAVDKGARRAVFVRQSLCAPQLGRRPQDATGIFLTAIKAFFNPGRVCANRPDFVGIISNRADNIGVYRQGDAQNSIKKGLFAYFHIHTPASSKFITDNIKRQQHFIITENETLISGVVTMPSVTQAANATTKAPAACRKGGAWM